MTQRCQVRNCINLPGPGRFISWHADKVAVKDVVFGDHIILVYLCDYHRYLNTNIQKNVKEFIKK